MNNSSNKLKSYRLLTSKGFSLLEVLLSASVFALIVTALAGVLIYSKETVSLSGKRFQVANLAEEGLEALRNIRDEGFSNLTAGTSGLAQGTTWSLSGASDTVGIFTRAETITSVSTHRKSVTSNITWTQNLQRTGSVSLETRFTNWRRDLGTWSTASLETSINLAGNANANGVAIYKASGITYAVIVRSSSADPEFYVYDISAPASPVAIGSLDLGTDAFDVVVSGNYALVATASNSQELMVINLTTPGSPTLTGSFNAAGNSDANAVAVDGNTVFIGRNQSTDPDIYSISISTPSSPSQLGTLDTTNTITELALGQSNQYLYASSIDNAGELVVVSVATPSSLSITSTYNPSGNSDGTGVTAFSTYALLGRASGEVDVVQLSTPSSPSAISTSLSLSNQVNDFAMGIGDLYAFSVIDSGASAVQIVDLSTLASPVSIASVASTANGNAIVYDFDINRAVAVSSGNSSEVYIVKPN